MTGLTSSPRTSRGTIVGVDPTKPLASVVAFQYNPDEMTRTLQARAATGGSDTSEGARNEALRLTGAPIEDISLTVEIDAADQLENGDPLATRFGIYPQLSGLEMLLYPKSTVVITNATLAAGSIEPVSPRRTLHRSSGQPVRVRSAPPSRCQLSCPVPKRTWPPGRPAAVRRHRIPANP